MKGKVVIITGASSGIGLACSREFAIRGANLVLAARSIDKLSSIEKEIKTLGVDAISVKADITSESDCKKIIERSIEHFKKIDVLVNNAGISMRALFNDTEISVIKQLMDVNFWGAVYCTKYALPYLLASRGSLVGVSSIAGFKGLPCRSGYSASKFAMQGFLETIRVENIKKDFHVMIVAPGFTASNIRKVALSADGSKQGESPREESKMMSAETVAKRIVLGVIKRRRTLIMTTVGKFTVFLSKFVPKMLDKMVYNHLAKEPDSPLK